MTKFFYTALFALLSLHALPNVPFETSMNACATYRTDLALRDKDWQFVKNLYENYQNNPKISEEYKIPKLIHLIWLGSPLPERCRLMAASWEKFHPDWTVKVWTDDDVEAFSLTNHIAFHRAKNYGEKSDIFRYEILYRHGGLYVDTDFECLQAFDELHKNCEFYTGIAQNERLYILIGLIGAIPGHPILKAAIENLRTGPGDWDLERIMNETGPYHFTKMFLQAAPSCEIGTVVAFPVTFFYPFPGAERHRTDTLNIKREYIQPESMAIHYFATSWQ